jgi:hypothetical protein
MKEMKEKFSHLKLPLDGTLLNVFVIATRHQSLAGRSGIAILSAVSFSVCLGI